MRPMPAIHKTCEERDSRALRPTKHFHRFNASVQVRSAEADAVNTQLSEKCGDMLRDLNTCMHILIKTNHFKVLERGPYIFDIANTMKMVYLAGQKPFSPEESTAKKRGATRPFWLVGADLQGPYA